MPKQKSQRRRTFPPRAVSNLKINGTGTPVPADLPQILDLRDFADFLGVHERWVRAHLGQMKGVIRHSRKMIRINVQEYLAGTHS